VVERPDRLHQHAGEIRAAENSDEAPGEKPGASFSLPQKRWQ